MKIRYLLIVALIMGSILRLYGLNNFPALNADEAAIGYNVYSLVETGMDEHGNNWPLAFQSFNDYKPGGYFYVALPFLYVLGLNTWVVRLPGAIFGIVCIYLIYKFVDLLFAENIKIGKLKFEIAEIAALFLAISPWHIHFSRGGWEVNMATTLILGGMYLLLKYLDENKRLWLYTSAVLFVVSLYTYHSARVVVPLLLVGVSAFNYKKLLKQKKGVVGASLLGIFLIIPLVWQILNGGALARAGGVSIFADKGIISGINEQRGEHGSANNNLLGVKLIHNKVVNYGIAFLKNWGSHYWGEFLFLSGDNIQRNRVPETGQMFMVDFVFVLLGIVYLVKSTKIKHKKVIFWWLLVAPTAAALTFQSPHALRAHNMVIPLVTLSALGVFSLLKYKKNTVWLIGLLLLWSFSRYQLMYWWHMSDGYPYSSQYGTEELVKYVESISDNYDKVIVTDRYDQPYILFLFYMAYPPASFQRSHNLTAPDEYGFSTVRMFDKYEFVSINYESARTIYPNSLLIGTDEEIPDSANIIYETYFPNGKIAYQVVSN